ncbi:hypothetical protein B0T26DRAFT_774857 [Lasiosphaeria miniovina]|uniref:Proteophosphoglycan ppg4 n=1 Tax=Lasiosphaeria miniovina TaxID=1954250 RepID=A0AA40AJL4_9PEZI|nr:uncharacterized protein B0T26DRAFT_774857 [Lasiosphaeria miniovina]KAK0717069.1 hypothetical protein B0T26DRAFT_774857 [Lasiosphaeria miniovina]
MGNTQSSIEAPRRLSHRLSKPKTGNHATAGLLSPNAFSSSSRRFSNARLSSNLPYPPPPSPSPASTPTTATTVTSADETTANAEQGIERSASVIVPLPQDKERRRRSLFRSKSSQATSDPKRRNSSLGPVSRVADKVGRANSMTYESAVAYYGQPGPESWPVPPRSRTSWNYDLTSYEAKRLLNLAEEPALELATTMSESRTVVTETTWKSSNPTNSAKPASTPVSRVNSDLSLYMPVRRRSVIQTPGVATRSNSARESPVASMPNFRFSHPPTPNLSRQQSFESYRGGVVSLPPPLHDPDSTPRVVTPCEDKYQSIGAFKLGSLRITNGAASPEIEKTRKRGEPGQDGIEGRGDYFGGAQPGEFGGTARAAVQPLVQQTEAPLPRIEAPQPRAARLSPIASSFLSIETTRNVSGSLSQEPAVTTSDVPFEFLAEIDFTPFSLSDSPLLSPQLQTTSKATALDDELFEDDAQPEYSFVEVLDVRLDPNAKPPHGQADRTTDTAVERSDSGFVSVSTKSPSTESAHKPLTKADSGYSSNVSLRSFQLKTQGLQEGLELSLEKQPSQSSQKSSETPSLPSQLHDVSSGVLYPAAPQRDPPPPPVPPKDLHSTSPRPSPIKASFVPTRSLSDHSRTTEVYLSPAGALRAAKHVPSPILSPPYDAGRLKSPETTPLTPTSATSVRSDNSCSALSIGSGSRRPGKLQRFLSGARHPAAGPLTVHATHVVEKIGIPSIPQDVEHKLRERIGLFPTTTKRLALKPRSSMDTLRTIFSVGSMDASVEALNSVPTAVPTVAKVVEVDDEDAPETKGNSWKQTLQSAPSSFVQVAAHMINPVARKPVPVGHQSLKGEGQIVKETPTADSTVPDTAESTTDSEGGSSVDNITAARTEVDDGGVTILSPTPTRRSMSLTAGTARGWDARLPAVIPPTTMYSNPDLPVSALPSPLLARAVASAETKARRSPPVSMMTRRSMPLRVPPPLRSQSSTASLTRQSSRESLQSYPSTQPLAKKASRDSIHSYPSQQGEMVTNSLKHSASTPTMDPRRIMSFRHSQPAQPSQSKTPNWDVQTDHDLSRRSSQTSLNGAWEARNGQPPPLRHRASYDGYSYQQRRIQKGHPPSMSNGYTAPAKPAVDPWSSNQFDAIVGQRIQDGPYPPHVPRGHHRTHSVGNRSGHNTNPPYRILHSYNSPAYRNVPIWG